MLSKSYKYLYFKVYQWNRKTFGKNDQPAFTALLHLSLFFFINLVVILYFLEMLFNRFFLAMLTHNKLYIISVALLILIINCIGLGDKKRLARSLKDFSRMPKIEKKRLDLVVRIYLVGSAVSLLVLFLNLVS